MRRWSMILLFTIVMPMVAGPARAANLPAPTFVTVPDDASSDSTPTWSFTGAPDAAFTCTLTQPFIGAWDGGPDGEQPVPPDVIVDSGRCDSGIYSFDLGSWPDHSYVLSVAQTDAAGTTSPAAVHGYSLDRVAWAPRFQTTPDDVSADPTPTWTFYGEYGSDFACTLVRSGSTSVDTAACTNADVMDQTYTFDLSAYPDDTYTLSVTQTDLAGNTSDAATDSFELRRAVEPPPPPNASPTASFTSTCSGRRCTFHGGGSGDPDGTIQLHGWDFGDGTSATGVSVEHAYAQAGTYTVTLTVTDDGGATATDSTGLTLIRLTARAYKVNGLRKVDLTWNGSSTAGFEVTRNGTTIAAVQATSYSDTVGKRGSATFIYRVCEVAASICSDEVTVSF